MIWSSVSLEKSRYPNRLRFADGQSHHSGIRHGVRVVISNGVRVCTAQEEPDSTPRRRDVRSNCHLPGSCRLGLPGHLEDSRERLRPREGRFRRFRTSGELPAGRDDIVDRTTPSRPATPTKQHSVNERRVGTGCKNAHCAQRALS